MIISKGEKTGPPINRTRQGGDRLPHLLAGDSIKGKKKGDTGKWRKKKRATRAGLKKTRRRKVSSTQNRHGKKVKRPESPDNRQRKRPRILSMNKKKAQALILAPASSFPSGAWGGAGKKRRRIQQNLSEGGAHSTRGISSGRGTDARIHAGEKKLARFREKKRPIATS